MYWWAYIEQADRHKTKLISKLYNNTLCSERTASKTNTSMRIHICIDIYVYIIHIIYSTFIRDDDEWWWWTSPSRISDMPQVGFEPVKNVSSGFVEWSCALVITTTPWYTLHLKKEVIDTLFQSKKNMDNLKTLNTYPFILPLTCFLSIFNSNFENYFFNSS